MARTTGQRPGGVSFKEDRPGGEREAPKPAEVEVVESRPGVDTDAAVSEERERFRGAQEATARAVARQESRALERPDLDRSIAPAPVGLQPIPGTWGAASTLVGRLGEGEMPQVEKPDTSPLETATLTGQAILAEMVTDVAEERARDKTRITNPFLDVEAKLAEHGQMPVEEIIPPQGGRSGFFAGVATALTDPLLRVFQQDSFSRDVRRFQRDMAALGYEQNKWRAKKQQILDQAGARVKAREWESAELADDLTLLGQGSTTLAQALTSQLGAEGADWQQDLANAQLGLQWQGQTGAQLSAIAQTMRATYDSRSDAWKNTLNGQQYRAMITNLESEILSRNERTLQGTLGLMGTNAGIAASLLKFQQEYGEMNDVQMDAMVQGILTGDLQAFVDSLPEDMPPAMAADLVGYVGMFAEQRAREAMLDEASLEEYNDLLKERRERSNKQANDYLFNVLTKASDSGNDPQNLWKAFPRELGNSIIASFQGHLERMVDSPEVENMFRAYFQPDENGNLIWTKEGWDDLEQALGDWVEDMGWSSVPLPTEPYQEQTDNEQIAWKFATSSSVMNSVLNEAQARMMSGNMHINDPIKLNVRAHVVGETGSSMDVSAIEDAELRSFFENSDQVAEHKTEIFRGHVEDLFRKNFIGGRFFNQKTPFGDNLRRLGGNFDLAVNTYTAENMQGVVNDLRQYIRARANPDLLDEVNRNIDDTQLTNLAMAVARESGAWDEYTERIDDQISSLAKFGANPSNYGSSWKELSDFRKSWQAKRGLKPDPTSVDEHIGMFIEELVTGREAG